MNAEILCVGTELLLGQVVNTNASYIAKGLAAIGINVFNHSVVGDNPQRLKKAVNEAFERNDIIIMTGGLGPTFDDLTKETVAEYFGCEMEMHEHSLARVEEFFKTIGREMSENNKKQAVMPKGAVVFDNFNGTAPGLAVEKNGKIAVLMPGPPNEMMPMFDGQVIPYLKKFTSGVLVSKNVCVFGLGESKVESILKDYMLSMENPTIAPYAKTGEMYLRVTAKAKDENEAQKIILPVIEKLKGILGEYVYGVDVPNMETALVQILSEKKIKAAFAESCTGGLISKKITDISGASQVYNGGVCTYSNEMKNKILGVSTDTLDKYGAVSEETAKEMAQGVRRVFNTEIGISTTGIAGPLGGTPQKPVGLVYVGVSTKNGTKAIKLNLARGYKIQRDVIRQCASLHAMYEAIIACGEF